MDLLPIQELIRSLGDSPPQSQTGEDEDLDCNDTDLMGEIVQQDLKD